MTLQMNIQQKQSIVWKDSSPKKNKRCLVTLRWNPWGDFPRIFV